jgi:hypothetical protein
MGAFETVKNMFKRGDKVPQQDLIEMHNAWPRTPHTEAWQKAATKFRAESQQFDNEDPSLYFRLKEIPMVTDFLAEVGQFVWEASRRPNDTWQYGFLESMVTSGEVALEELEKIDEIEGVSVVELKQFISEGVETARRFMAMDEYRAYNGGK